MAAAGRPLPPPVALTPLASDRAEAEEIEELRRRVSAATRRRRAEETGR